MDDNIKTLSESLKGLGEGLNVLSQAAEESSNGLAGFLQTVGTAIEVGASLKDTVDIINDKLGEFFKIVKDSGPMKAFSQNVTTNADKIGETFTGLSNRTTSVKKILGSFCDSGREKFSGLLQGVKNLEKERKKTSLLSKKPSPTSAFLT